MRDPLSSDALGAFLDTLDGASALQRRIARRVRETPLRRSPRWVAGLDVSYEKRSGLLHAAAVLFDARTREPVETGRYTGPVAMPYVPGFLSFREGPALLHALAALSRRPDLLLCDGQGRAHPRRCGIASHLGVALGVPSVGVAKSRLVGRAREPGRRRGSTARLTDAGDVIGLVVRTRSGVRPLFVSVGHRVTLEDARSAVLSWARRVRLPEPVHAADREVAAMKRHPRDRGDGGRQAG